MNYQKKIRVYFVDKKQKMKYVNITMRENTGIITGVPKAVPESTAQLYLNMPVRRDDIVSGNRFKFGNTEHEFLAETLFEIKEIREFGKRSN